MKNMFTALIVMVASAIASAQGYTFYPGGTFGLGTFPTLSVVNSTVAAPADLPPGFDGAVGEFATGEPGTVFTGLELANGVQPDVQVMSLSYPQDTIGFRLSVYGDRLRSHHGLPAGFDVLAGETHAVIYAAPVTTTMATGIGDVLAFGGAPVAPLCEFVIPAAIGPFPVWIQQREPGGFWEPRAGDTVVCTIRKDGPFLFGADLTGLAVSVQALYAIPDGAGSYWAVLPTFVEVTL